MVVVVVGITYDSRALKATLFSRPGMRENERKTYHQTMSPVVHPPRGLTPSSASLIKGTTGGPEVSTHTPPCICCSVVRSLFREGQSEGESERDRERGKGGKTEREGEREREGGRRGGDLI